MYGTKKLYSGKHQHGATSFRGFAWLTILCLAVAALVQA